jgi:hypothetical protein
MDFSTLIPWVCASLNCPTTAELDPWTATELYTYATEALRKASRNFYLCLTLDATTALVAAQGFYSLPAGHILTIYMAVNGTMIRATTVAELEALDDDWENATPATPTRWTENAQGLIMVRTYPAPAAVGTLTIIYQKESPDLTAGSPVAQMPAILGDYLALRVLEQARSRQGDAQMADCAASFGGVATLIEGAMESYWGAGL